MMLVSPGCWSDIRYDPAAEGQSAATSEQPSPPADSDPPEAAPEFSLFDESTTPEPEPDPAIDSTDDAAVSADSEPPDLFADVNDGPQEPVAEETDPQPFGTTVTDTTVVEEADTPPNDTLADAEEPDAEDDLFESIIMGSDTPAAEPEEPAEPETTEPAPEPETLADTPPANLDPMVGSRRLTDVVPSAEETPRVEAVTPAPLADMTPPRQTPISDLLPWQTASEETPDPPVATELAPRYPVREEPKPEEPAREDPAPIVSTESPDLAWAAPTTEPETPAPAAELPAPEIAEPVVELPEPEPTREAEPQPQPPAVASADTPEWQAPQPMELEPLDPRQQVWHLASRLSYLLVAPNVEGADIETELGAAAEALELELPKLKTTEPGSAEQLRQLLTVGRQLGHDAGDKYGMEDAALVEVAFKSNLLLAVAESRPQLKHSISGSVSAAAVRAGLPESVWQPFQNNLADSDQPAELTDAVVELHSGVGQWLKQSTEPSPDDEPPVLR
ncbi:hypothetical protein NG895_24345 [Aeoliella sp. ICT_H6.2]|uniref:Uncharacterized protein n=1 Tax=Aeoliella straminimaris TaxID=2954799 RepID=A0A9X2FDG4_9BACT|nr:hypothetical protein [Aeoliella straminimaris]MCO6047042.1 hypothetical protein [Aeoliella straminimaris]